MYVHVFGVVNEKVVFNVTFHYTYNKNWNPEKSSKPTENETEPNNHNTSIRSHVSLIPHYVMMSRTLSGWIQATRRILTFSNFVCDMYENSGFDFRFTFRIFEIPYQKWKSVKTSSGNKFSPPKVFLSFALFHFIYLFCVCVFSPLICNLTL